jgi:hypothetical protein
MASVAKSLSLSLIFSRSTFFMRASKTREHSTLTTGTRSGMFLAFIKTNLKPLKEKELFV